MKPFSTLKIRFIDKNMGEVERRLIFGKLADNVCVESASFDANPDYALLFYKCPSDVIKVLTRRPPNGILMTVHLDDLSKSLDPQILEVRPRPMCLKGRLQDDVKECGGIIFDKGENFKGDTKYFCNFGSFYKLAIAWEKLFSNYFLYFRQINPSDTWKHDVINDISGKLYSVERRVLKDIENVAHEKQSEPRPSLPPPVIPDKLPTAPPAPIKIDCNTKLNISLPIVSAERKFKFYIRVQNDSQSVSKLDEFIHELEGYKKSMIMDSRSDPKWRYIRAEFDTNEQTEDAYNIMQIFPIQTKVHYFLDFLK
ncbi:hypothetical protein ACFFRR_010657 [Megaselia abdita]